MKRVLAVYRHLKESEPYQAALRQAGMEPVLRLPSKAPALAEVDGLLLMGGEDVNPALYQQEPHPATEKPDDERDAVELRLIREAVTANVPVFAICRGLQIVNVEHGGTLVQDVADRLRHRKRPVDKATPAHTVVIEPDTLLRRVLGAPEASVNSRHHQAIERLGNGLFVSARDSEDQTIEAVERNDLRFFLGVQWHPENQSPVDPLQARLFEAFAAAL
ncbi:gamma-glutamyl-gamma-aminobutyrate hydrolase family protein [Nevskia soli]|jgi:gamma-glutamyl-gamma-aminobutyrate hydrolase PuuD|uniref:gamma-glutamyl-gamma-aminobutyrate hydrolase family protein n=1 Tax=Nevskia soli TaxID=418856 RepID=UPI0015D70203|nr:gamma-glutamyl-gamma-aminobutyrate hydrolase family protein [Nevskia soli]